MRFTAKPLPFPPPPTNEELRGLDEDEFFWDQVEKHYGPGNHPGTGTPQTVHGSSRIAVQVGSGFLNKKPIEKHLVNADGSELLFSFEALDEAYVMVNGEVKPTDKAVEIQGKILAKLEELGLDRAMIDSNIDRVWRSAMARYKADPSLIDQDRFYEMWHEVLYNISEDTGIEFSRTVAAASVLSPSLNAWSNIHYANDLAHWITEDVLFEGDEARQVLGALKEAQNGILNPVWLAEHQGVLDKKHEAGDPKDPPKPGSARWLQGQSVLADYEKLKGRDSFRVSELGDLSAAYALHKYRAIAGGLEVDVPEPLAIDHATGKRLPFPQGGFSVKNMGFFGDAIGVIRGNISPSEALGDVKTRSFHNNILDPYDFGNFQDVTVDFHMANAAFMSTGFEDSNAISSPTIEGVGVGIRPLVADSIRRYVGTKLGKEKLSSGRVQEILWAEWSRGQREFRHVPKDATPVSWFDPNGKVSKQTITHWQGFDEIWYPLYNLKRRTT